METLKKFFPFSFKEKKDVTALVINIIIYVVVGAIAGALIGLLYNVPVLGAILSVVGSLISVYTTAGIVLSVLHYVKVLK